LPVGYDDWRVDLIETGCLRLECDGARTGGLDYGKRKMTVSSERKRRVEVEKIWKELDREW